MLVSAAQLALHLNDPAWVIFDCRHDLMDHAKGERLYREGHIPGAHFARVETDLSGRKTGTNGRHPLPPSGVFIEFLAAHGVTNTSTVVAYDDVGGQYAARLWWMTRWIGLKQVHVLDGGLPKWLAGGRAVTTEVPVPRATILLGEPDPAMMWDTAQVAAHMAKKEFTLIDARAPGRYRGEVEPIDPVAGHIPGAVNRFYQENLNADLTLRRAEELKGEFNLLTQGRRPDRVGHHCGSGVTACANILAMECAGLSGSKLYVGSWSEWISDPSRPVARGAEPQ